MDFTQTPPGMLALDNMLYLAKFHQDTYIRVSDAAGFLQIPTPQQLFLVCVASSSCRLFWRTAVGKISMSVPLGAVPLSLPGCFVRSCKLGNSVSTIFCRSFPGCWADASGSSLQAYQHAQAFVPRSHLSCVRIGGAWSCTVSVAVIIPISK